MVQSTESVKQLDTPHHRFGCWRVEEVESDEIVDSEGLEEENDGGEVGSLNLGDGVGFEFVVESPLGVQTEALTGSNSTCSTCSLVGCCSGALQKRENEKKMVSSRKGGGIEVEEVEGRRTGTTVREAMPVFGLYEFCLTNPGSIT